MADSVSHVGPQNKICHPAYWIKQLMQVLCWARGTQFVSRTCFYDIYIYNSDEWIWLLIWQINVWPCFFWEQILLNTICHPEVTMCLSDKPCRQIRFHTWNSLLACTSFQSQMECLHVQKFPQEYVIRILYVFACRSAKKTIIAFHEQLVPFIPCFEYPLKWCTWSCSLAFFVYTIQPCTSLQCHFI